MAKRKDLYNQKFGKLLVLDHGTYDRQKRKTMYKCICDCGNETMIIGTRLIMDKTKSCGCLRIEKNRQRTGVNHYNYNGGMYNQGSLAWAEKKLRSIKTDAKINNHALPLITANEIVLRWKACSGKCMICRQYSSKLGLDHCHITGTARGFICTQCNTGLGMFRDDVHLLKAATSYIDFFRRKKNKPPAIYLAGPISGLTYEQANGWREYVSNKLPSGIKAVSPLRDHQDLLGFGPISKEDSTHPLRSASGITTRDRFDVMNCDVVLMHLLNAGKVTVGTMIEIGWCDILRKPLVLVMEPNNLHKHPMIDYISGFITSDLDEAIDICISILRPYIENETARYQSEQL